MIKVTRIQYPVGQGCFHVGAVKWDNGSGAGCFRYVYDCGSKNKTALKRSMNSMRQQHKGIDALFVSHLHDDHVNGLNRLLGSVRVNMVFIPHLRVGLAVANLVAAATDNTLSYSLIEASLAPHRWFGQRGVYRIVEVQPSPLDEAPVTDTDSEDSPEDREPLYSEISLELHEMREEGTVTPAVLESMKSGEMLAPGAGSSNLDWVFVPHVDPEPQAISKFETEIANVFSLSNLKNLTVKRLAEALRDTQQRKARKGCYTRCFGANHNRVSMSVYSGPKSDPEKKILGVFFWILVARRNLLEKRLRLDWNRRCRTKERSDQECLATFIPFLSAQPVHIAAPASWIPSQFQFRNPKLSSSCQLHCGGW